MSEKTWCYFTTPLTFSDISMNVTKPCCCHCGYSKVKAHHILIHDCIVNNVVLLNLTNSICQPSVIKTSKKKKNISL